MPTTVLAINLIDEVPGFMGTAAAPIWITSFDGIGDPITWVEYRKLGSGYYSSRIKNVNAYWRFHKKSDADSFRVGLTKYFAGRYHHVNPSYEHHFPIYVVDIIGQAKHPAKPTVYVGQTWHTVANRLRNHSSGNLASIHAPSFGQRLPELEPPSPDFDAYHRANALVGEAFWARHLLEAGFHVLGDGPFNEFIFEMPQPIGSF